MHSVGTAVPSSAPSAAQQGPYAPTESRRPSGSSDWSPPHGPRPHARSPGSPDPGLAGAHTATASARAHCRPETLAAPPQETAANTAAARHDAAPRRPGTACRRGGGHLGRRQLPRPQEGPLLALKLSCQPDRDRAHAARTKRRRIGGEGDIGRGRICGGGGGSCKRGKGKEK